MLRKYFPYVVIPQIAMLAYAIYLRIAQYDLTMNRYFVVIFGLWLLGISLYYVASKRKSLAIIPASLSLISLIISLGPWSVFTYPQIRQETRLVRNLETAQILQGNTIVPLKSERDISKELSTEIAAGIDYLCNFDDCARIKEIFPIQAQKAETKSREDWEKWNKENTGAIYPWVSNWEISSTITTELKVHRYPYDDQKREFPESKYLLYNLEYKMGWQFPLTITGYDRIVQVTSEPESKYPSPTELSYPYLSIDPDTSMVRYYTASGISDTYTLEIPEKLLDSATLSTVSESDLTFDVSDKERSIKILLQNFSVKNPRYQSGATDLSIGVAYPGGISGMALIKEKK